MRRLLLMRHAEAASEAAGQTDFDRPLTRSGERVAGSMGRSIRDRESAPQIVICSPAARAVQTTKLFIENAALDVEIMLDERIYEATPQSLCQIVLELDDNFDALLMVGHNPGFEGLLAFFTGIRTPMRAGAVACVELQIARWSAARSVCGRLSDILQPEI